MRTRFRAGGLPHERGQRRDNCMNVAQSVVHRLLRFASLALLIVLPVASAWAQSTELAPPAGVAPLTSSESRSGACSGRPIVVKIVMLGLLVASVWGWAIIIDKTCSTCAPSARWTGSRRCSGPASRSRSSTARYRARADAFDGRAVRCRDARVEAQLRGRRADRGLQTRIEKVMDVTIAREIERLERRLLVLATVGSAAPFIGLFGTVWGIMTSFQSIAASKNTSLAVVAPGIAEALLATALGLLAAIPAMIVYNKFVAEVGKSASGWKASPTSLPRSCRARSTKRREGEHVERAVQAAGFGGRPAPPRGKPVDERDQRHADRGRDAGAAHRLHGLGAAAHRRRADRPAADPGQEHM